MRNRRASQPIPLPFPATSRPRPSEDAGDSRSHGCHAEGAVPEADFPILRFTRTGEI